MVSSAFLTKIERLDPYLQDVMLSLIREVEESASVNRREFNELKSIVRELAEVQKETKIELKELAEAQKKTEEEVRTLAINVKGLQKQIGGLSMTVGYGLEDKIIPYIYDFGKKEFGIDVSIADRRNIIYADGKYDEVNIYAEGMKNGKSCFIIGECKSQPDKKDIDKFNQVTERLKKALKGEMNFFIAGYQFTPDVEAYLAKKYPHLRVFKSYDFELKYKKKSK